MEQKLTNGRWSIEYESENSFTLKKDDENVIAHMPTQDMYDAAVLWNNDTVYDLVDEMDKRYFNMLNTRFVAYSDGVDFGCILKSTPPRYIDDFGCILKSTAPRYIENEKVYFFKRDDIDDTRKTNECDKWGRDAIDSNLEFDRMFYFMHSKTIHNLWEFQNSDGLAQLSE